MLNNANGKLIHRAMTLTTDTAGTGVLDAVNDRAVVDCEDLTYVEVWTNQLVDAGTATLVIEKSVDGTNFAPVATLTDASFALGANKSVVSTLSDSNGMPLHCKQIRVTCTVEGADGGSYSFGVVGRQLSSHR